MKYSLGVGLLHRIVTLLLVGSTELGQALRLALRGSPVDYYEDGFFLICTAWFIMIVKK